MKTFFFCVKKSAGKVAIFRKWAYNIDKGHLCNKGGIL